MKNELVLSHSASAAVAISNTIDGIEMGVLNDGRAYLTGRALARLCGVAVSTIINQAERWLAGERTNKLAQLLVARGLERPSLYETVDTGRVVAGSTIAHAYPDQICTAILEYYAFESNPISPQAQANFRKLANAGLRVFVYQALGYDPARQLTTSWRNFHDRLALHAVPTGHFSVFKECADFVLASIRAGLPVDDHTIPDISVGKMWAAYWVSEGLSARFGERTKHDHNYPDYYPQAASNPQEIWVYPVDALGVFRRWLDSTYLPEKYPAYLDKKVKKGLIAASTVELLLAEVAPLALPETTP